MSSTYGFGLYGGVGGTYAEPGTGTLLPSDIDAIAQAVFDLGANVISVNGTDTTNIDDFKATGFSTPANITDAQTAIIAEVDANEAKIDTAITQATLARKHLTNRDKIDTTANTLTRYDDDGTTSLVVFDLKDGDGVASTTSIFEKDPQ